MAYTLTYKLINNDTEYSVAGYTGEPIDVVIPKEYNALPVTTIGYRAFYKCSSLTEIVIPDSVTSIGDDAFHGCGSLTEIVIPDGVTRIESRTFENCSNLTKIVIPDSITRIGTAAFGNCDSLTSIAIPEGVTSIGRSAFENCDSLTSVVIGDSVTSIDEYAFGGCSKLTKVTLLAKTPASLLSTNTFSSKPIFYCFSEAIEAYKTTTNWNVFANNFVADDMRLYFTMSSTAQKKYFVSKEDVTILEQNMQTYIQQYIRDNFATLMAEYLNSAEATDNKPTTNI